MESIFQKIINGEIPCHRIYENEYVLAFLDVSPLSVGHTLVIPKEAAASLHELSEESGEALGKALVIVSKAIVKATGVPEYNILQNNGALANQAVFHVHFHIIPKPCTADGLVINWKPQGLQEGETTRRKDSRSHPIRTLKHPSTYDVVVCRMIPIQISMMSLVIQLIQMQRRIMMKRQMAQWLDTNVGRAG